MDDRRFADGDVWKRVTECDAWRWLPGMRAVDERGYGWRRLGSEGWMADGGHALKRPQGDIVPDLSDPATLGCLQHIVLEVWEMSKRSEMLTLKWTQHECYSWSQMRHQGMRVSSTMGTDHIGHWHSWGEMLLEALESLERGGSQWRSNSLVK